MVVCSRMQTSGIVLICIFLSTVNSLRDIDGVQVDGINFNPVCATGAACWEISITYRLSQGHWYSMYIPKSVSQPSGDSNSAKSTFDPDFFPCNAYGKGAQASTICCLADVMADYHPLGNALLRIERTLGEDVATFGATTCLDDTAIPSFGGAHGLSLPATEIEGNFLGLTSKIIPKMVLDAELGVYQAVVLLDENELLSSTGMVESRQGSTQYSVETFIGLYHFKPTGSTNLSPNHRQISLRLEKSDASIAGTHTLPSTHPFIESVSASLVQVLQHDDQRLSKRVHYVKVDVALAGGNFKAPDTSAGFIPLDSISLSHTAAPADVRRPCSEFADPQPGAMGFFSTPAMTFDQAMEQQCAPKDALCKPPRDLSSGQSPILSVSIPVDAAGLCSNCGARVRVSFEVDAQDADRAGASLRSIVTVSVSADSQFVVTYCQPAAALHGAEELQGVARLDLIAGSATTASGVKALPTLMGLGSASEQRWAEPTSVGASSLADAVLTLVVEGDQSHFASNPQAHLVLEDVITVHFMEPEGSSLIFDQAAALTAASAPTSSSPSTLASSGSRTKASATSYPSHAVNAAFSVAFDTADNRFHLHPSQALLDLCPSSPKPSRDALLPHVCVTRRDVRYGRPVSRPWPGVSTAVRIEASEADGSWSEASAFMTAMLGESSGIGESFGKAMWEERGLGERRVRQAWWINPGYQWAAASGNTAFFLSQRLLLVALFAIDDAPTQGGRRALLATMDGVGSQVRGATVQFEASAEATVSEALAADAERVGRIRVKMALTTAEACQPLAELQGVYQAKLAALLESVSKGLETAEVLSLAVDRGQEGCDDVGAGRRRTLLSKDNQVGFSSASVQAEMLLVFEEGATPFVDMQKLNDADGVVSATASSLPSHVLLATPDDEEQDEEEDDDQEDEKDEDGEVDTEVKTEFRTLDEGGKGSSPTTAIIAALSSVGAACVLAGAGVVVWRRRQKRARAPSSEGESVHADLQAIEEDGGLTLPLDATAGAESGAYQSKLEVASATSKGGERPAIWWSTRKSEDGQSEGRASAAADRKGDAV